MSQDFLIHRVNDETHALRIDQVVSVRFYVAEGGELANVALASGSSVMVADPEAVAALKKVVGVTKTKVGSFTVPKRQ